MPLLIILKLLVDGGKFLIDACQDPSVLKRRLPDPHNQRPQHEVHHAAADLLERVTHRSVPWFALRFAIFDCTRAGACRSAPIGRYNNPNARSTTFERIVSSLAPVDRGAVYSANPFDSQQTIHNTYFDRPEQSANLREQGMTRHLA